MSDTTAAARAAFEAAALEQQTQLEYRQLAAGGFTFTQTPAPVIKADSTYQLPELVSTSSRPLPREAVAVLVVAGALIALELARPRRSSSRNW